MKKVPCSRCHKKIEIESSDEFPTNPDAAIPVCIGPYYQTYLCRKCINYVWAAVDPENEETYMAIIGTDGGAK